MLEIVIVAMLCLRNGRVADAKGRSKSQQWLLTIGFWFGAEVVGAFIGVAVFGSQGNILGPVYLLALVCAVIGGVASYVYTNSLAVQPWAGLPLGFVPTHTIPVGGMPVFDYPDASRRPVGTAVGRDRVMAVSVAGDWIQIRTIQGWMGWVDGRRLVPVNPEGVPPAFTPPGA